MDDLAAEDGSLSVGKIEVDGIGVARQPEEVLDLLGVHERHTALRQRCCHLLFSRTAEFFLNCSV